MHKLYLLIVTMVLMSLFLCFCGCIEKSTNDTTNISSNDDNAMSIELNAALALQNASQDFVNTVAGILAIDDMNIGDESIVELEQVIILLGDAQEKLDYDVNASLNKSLEVQQRLGELRNDLGTQLVEFADLHVPAPSPAGEKYVILSGLWIRETRLALQELERFKEDGANNILIIVPLDCDAELNFTVPTKEAIAMYVQAAHKSGMSVTLMLGQGPPAGYSRGWHGAFFNDEVNFTGEAVLDALTPLVIEWVEFAEEYDVEVFMPLLEPIMWASMMPTYWEMNDQDAANVTDIVSGWMQELLPVMRERYSGKLMFATHNRITGSSNFFELNFTGYDYISNWEAGDEITTELLNECASCTSCEGVVHHITLYVGGLWFEPAGELTEEEQARDYEEYFKRTWDYELTAGIMLELGVGKEYWDRPAEEIVESWLNDTDKVPTKNIDALWRTNDLFKMLDSILSPEEVTFSEEWLEDPTD